MIKKKSKPLSINLNELSKRTKPISDTQDATNLRVQLSNSSYSKTGNLHKRVEYLHRLMTNDVRHMLEKLKIDEKISVFLMCLIVSMSIGLILFILAPYSQLVAKIFGEQRLPITDSIVNILMSAAIVLFAVRQWLREKSQRRVKQTVDELHALIHLLDMHQLAKFNEIDRTTRLVIADAIILCGKVGAHIHDQTDDPYVVGSVKHLENYSELVASRIIQTN